MDIKIDEAIVKNVVSEAILTALSQDERNMLIRSALRHLLDKGTSSYDRESPIEKAFHSAVRDVAKNVAVEMMASDPQIIDALKGLVREALDRLMTLNREKTVEKLADAIAAGMAYRSRD